jgi:hypothetical protein
MLADGHWVDVSRICVARYPALAAAKREKAGPEAEATRR